MDVNKYLAGIPGCNKYGASMGRAHYADRDSLPPRVYLQRVRFTDGCYDPGGAYWGAPADLWCAIDASDSFRWFVRAPYRKAAATALRAEFPGLRIYGIPA